MRQVGPDRQEQLEPKNYSHYKSKGMLIKVTEQ